VRVVHKLTSHRYTDSSSCLGPFGHHHAYYVDVFSSTRVRAYVPQRRRRAARRQTTTPVCVLVIELASLVAIAASSQIKLSPASRQHRWICVVRWAIDPAFGRFTLANACFLPSDIHHYCNHHTIETRAYMCQEHIKCSMACSSTAWMSRLCTTTVLRCIVHCHLPLDVGRSACTLRG
jgi:hypothetical protein